ncbi:MAG: PDZ domain-containing protein [Planctomycetes bacterium]|nr:PDZ domain-containing protein [Planctomycetota bacterium]
MRARLLAAALLGAAALAVGAGAGEDPPRPPAPPAADPDVGAVVLSEPVEDADGEARSLDAEARGILDGRDGARADPAAAAERWMDLVERDPAARLPAPQAPSAPAAVAPHEGLWWPAREVALARLGALPPEGRAAVERRWGPQADAWLAQAQATRERAPLERLARERPVTRAGGVALLLLADLAAAEGRAADAVRHLDAWWRAHPEADLATKAAVAARQVDACAVALDERGVLAVSRRAAALATVPVARGRTTETVADAVAGALTDVRVGTMARAAREDAGPVVPTAPAVLFERRLGDPGLVDEPDLDGPGARAPGAAVAADGDALYVVEDRVARRLDVVSGRERWAWPDPATLRREWSPRARYRWFEAPVRAAVPAGDLVLVVLGDPPTPATASFLRRGGATQPEDLAREARSRVVALDAATGQPRWTTGGLDDRHPVLRAGDVGVVAPPRVVGTTAYVLLSARRAGVVSWLAALDVATGRPRFVTALSRGESGLLPPDDDPRALVEARLRALPRGLVPSVADGEVVAVPGTGYAAGVGAADGRVRWVRALPRYEDPPPSPDETAPNAFGLEPFDPRNEPIAVAGTWVLAAPDAPRCVGVEVGSGRLRWIAPGRPRVEGAADGPETAHVLAVAPGADGRPLLRAAGTMRALDVRDANTGGFRALPSFPAWARREGPDAGAACRGRPWSEGRRVVVARDGTLRAATWPTRTGERFGEDAERVRVSDGTPLPTGDVVRAGERWVVVGADRLVVLARDAAAVSAARAAAAPTDPVARARAALADAAAPGADDARLAAATRLAAASGDASVVALARDAVVARVRTLAPGDAAADARVLAVVDAADALPVGARAEVHRDVAAVLVARRRHAALVTLVGKTLRFGEETTVAADAAGRSVLRADLLAATRLPFATATPEGRAALTERETFAERLLARAAARGPDAIEAALRVVPGTAAAFAARARLAGLYLDLGRADDAAAVWADLRTAPAPGPVTAPAVAVALRALEGEALASAGDREPARRVLDEARRHGPAAARRADGAPAAHAEAELAGELAFAPDVEGSEEPTVRALFASGGAPTDAALLSVAVVEPSGPGAGPSLDTALLSRGVDLETLSLADGTRAPVAPVDAGFLGAVLLDVEPSLPGGGVLLASVTTGGPADRAGLRDGDAVVAVDGAAGPTRSSLTRRAVEAAAGTTLRLTVVRDGERRTVAVPVGRRGERMRAPIAPAHGHVRADGRWVVVSRLGLRLVDPAAATSRPLWRHDGPGDVRDLVTVGDAVVVWTADAPLGDGTLVAVDPRTGRERWRAALQGRLVGEPRAAGSALVVDTTDPDRTWVFDRRTGALRGSHARAEDAGFGFWREAAVRPVASAVAGGCPHLLAPGAAGTAVWVVGLDPATAWPTWSRQAEATAEDGRALTRLFPPVLAGDGVLALAFAEDELRVFLPDLRGGLLRPEPLVVDGSRFEVRSWGTVDADARVAVVGDAIHLVRTSRDRRANVGTMEIDRRACRDPEAEDPAVWHPARAVTVPGSRLPAEAARSIWPVATAVRATADGVWTVFAWLPEGTGASEGAVAWWDPGDADRLRVWPVPASVRYVQPPVRVGSVALVRTDEGLLAVPLRAPR